MSAVDQNIYMHIEIKKTAIHIRSSRVHMPSPAMYCLLLNNFSIFLRQIIIHHKTLPLVWVAGCSRRE
jgi:hypothetical protein